MSTVDATSDSRGRLAGVRTRFADDRARNWLWLSLLVLVLLFGVFGLPELTPYNPTAINEGAQLEAPSWQHLFGTDINQMDVFSRVLKATRVDIGISLISTVIAFALGFPLGILSGYYSGPIAQLLLRVLDMVQAFPVLVLALVIVGLAGNSASNVVYAQIFVATPIMIRVIRSVVVRLREERFIEASIATGNSATRVLWRHIAPHALPTALIQSTILMAGALILTTGLSFIGVGVRPPEPEWGAMVGLGSRDIASGDWWTIAFPGMAIGITVYTFNLIGMILRRQFPDAGH